MLGPNRQQEIGFPPERQGSGDGFYLHDLACGTVVEIGTKHHRYRLVKRADASVRISGHPTFCPEPVEVEVEGSFGSRRRLNPHPGFIGLGMYLAFKHPRFRNLITTSRIREIHKLA